MVQLSKRLSAVAQLVTITGILADVGTDHGYIPVYLTGKEQIKKAIAMDVNQGPLERAQEHIRQYGLENRIETRLSDGLQALKPKEVEGIVIAGMGGNLMKRILMQGEQVAHTAKELILQPQSEVMEFRKFLWESGYTIVAEDMVLEDGKYYPMMRVVYENAQKEIPDVLALKYGEKLLEQKHPVLKQYLLWQKMQKEKILGNLQKNAKKDVSSRKEEIEEELSYIAHALEKIDGAK
ncbi:MAG: SAM-dependent methyltransferase [Clostridiales bacterium]|uniref:tRNA (adenine(22)-N(1))-methyltransferase n=1 Tax=Roseburia sp. MSJ-14 TaxID=2841514 RepID=UPI0016B71F93|nr:class I SAM-dependent methyltransferase [Roseburia sp. MSJ-14]MBU5472102.1 class I SAM-dependent methyltransferase [Roseburia sp. MSJ-14]NLK77479.1 SAM-dependent methyltransferase [Clostridiales bacterium]